VLLQDRFNGATLTIIQRLQLTGPDHGSRSLFFVVNLDDGHAIGSETSWLLNITCNRGYKTLSTGVLNKTYPAQKEKNLGMQT